MLTIGSWGIHYQSYSQIYRQRPAVSFWMAYTIYIHYRRYVTYYAGPIEFNYSRNFDAFSWYWSDNPWQGLLSYRRLPNRNYYYRFDCGFGQYRYWFSSLFANCPHTCIFQRLRYGYMGNYTVYAHG